MEIKNPVQIVKDKGNINQFGNGPLYRGGASGSKKVTVASIVLLGIVILIAIINGSPKAQDQSQQNNISIPELATQNTNEVDLPKFEGTPANAQRARTFDTPTGFNHLKKLSGPQLIARPKTSNIPPASTVKGVLLSGASNGLVKAQTTEALIVNGEEIIPQGTIILGTGQSSEEGLVVQFSQMVFEDGSAQVVQAKALDFNDKMPRLKGSQVGYYGVKLATTAGLNFISGLADGLQEKDTNGQVVIEKPTIKNALLNGTSRAALDVSQETLSSMKNKPPVVEVKSGAQIWIVFE